MNWAPIALFVYNRPEHTRLTVEALKSNPEASQSRLFIFSDAASNDVDKAVVDEVRKYIHQVEGFAEVNIIERDRNWGLANSIIDGVTQLCEQFGRVIVLEDDLLVSPHFLTFMNQGLDRYAEDELVMQIAGYMFPAHIRSDTDAIFLNFISSWGWATWSRAWAKFDKEANSYKILQQSKDLRRRFDLDDNYPYFKMLTSQQSGKTQSWAIRWYLSVFFNDGLVLYPKKTLVDNIGFDGTGQNCLVSTIHESSIDKNFMVELLPEKIELSLHFNQVLEALPKPKLNFKLLWKQITMKFKS